MQPSGLTECDQFVTFGNQVRGLWHTGYRTDTGFLLPDFETGAAGKRVALALAKIVQNFAHAEFLALDLLNLDAASHEEHA